EHDESDGFIEGIHEEVDVFFYLLWLIRGADDHQVRRKKPANRRELLVDVFSKLGNLLSRAHEDGDGHCAASMPPSICVPRGIEIEEARGRLVTAADIHQVPQINRTSRSRCPDDDVTNGCRRLEGAGWIHDDVLLACNLDRASRQCDVSRLQKVLKF